MCLYVYVILHISLSLYIYIYIYIITALFRKSRSGRVHDMYTLHYSIVYYYSIV